MLSLGKHVVRCLETVINEPEWKIPKTPTKSSWRNFKSFRFWILFVISVTTLTITPIASYNIWLSKGLSGLISFVTGIGAVLAAVGVFVAIFELKESLLTRQMEIAEKLFELYGCEESRKEREYVLTNSSSLRKNHKNYECP